MPSNTLLYKSVAYKLEDIAADQPGVQGLLRLHRSGRAARRQHAGVHRLREGAARPAQLRPRRRRLGDRAARQAAGEGGRHLHGGRALPRHRTGAAGGGGRPARVHGRAAGAEPAAARGRPGEDPRADEPRAARRRAEAADARRAGRADHQLRLVGHVRRRRASRRPWSTSSTRRWWRR